MNTGGILQAPSEYRNNHKYYKRKSSEHLKEISVELMVLTILYIKINRSSVCLKSYSGLVDGTAEHFQAVGLDFLYISSVGRHPGMAWTGARQHPARSTEFLGTVWELAQAFPNKQFGYDHPI